jgi:hypothetical protein
MASICDKLSSQLTSECSIDIQWQLADNDCIGADADIVGIGVGELVPPRLFQVTDICRFSFHSSSQHA